MLLKPTCVTTGTACQIAELLELVPQNGLDLVASALTEAAAAGAFGGEYIAANTPFSEWGNILLNTPIARAIADRLVENSEIFLLKILKHK